MSDAKGTQARYDELERVRDKAHRKSQQAQKQLGELKRGKIHIFSENGHCHPICTFFREGIKGRCSMWAANTPYDDSGYIEARPGSKCPGDGFYRLVREDD